MGEYLTTTWSEGGILFAANLNQNLADTGWNVLVQGQWAYRGFIGHSSTKLSNVDSAGTIRYSADGGDTWVTAAGTHALGVGSFMRVCKANKALGIAVETGTANDAAATLDSGATWNATAVSAAFGTALYDVSYSTASLVVLGGNDTAGTDHIVWGTVTAGDVAAWTNAATSPSAAIYAVDMFDADYGFAIDSGQKVWRSNNTQATVWTDTGFTVGASSTGSSIHCLTNNSFLYATGSRVYLYDGSGNATLVINMGATADTPLGIIELTNGNVVIGVASINADRAAINLLMTDNSGVKWFIKTLAPDAIPTGTPSTKCSLTEIGSNNIGVVFKDNQAIKIYGGTDNT